MTVAFSPVRMFVDIARGMSDEERAYIYDLAEYLWATHHAADHFHCCGPDIKPMFDFVDISEHLRNVWLTVAANAYAAQRSHRELSGGAGLAGLAEFSKREAERFLGPKDSK